MLRASSDHDGADYGLQDIIDGGGASGVADAALLLEFAEAMLSEDGARRDAARQELWRTLGDAALVDAAGVVASFDAVVKLADASGIPLEGDKARATERLRAELGLRAGDA